MQSNIKLVPMFLTLSFAFGSVAAQPPGAPTKSMVQDKASAGEQFMNEDQEQQLRHRVNENDPESAKKVRDMSQGLQDKQSKHQYRYEEKAPGQHMHQSGSRMGGGGGGGGRR